MRKAKQPGVAELRPEYRRSDFGAVVRGKYVERLRERSNVVVIDPRVTEFFPSPESVNAALLSLAEIARRAPSQSAARVTRARRKRRAG
jgi:hypothetical protein